MSVVVGIFPDHAAVGKLVDALEAAGFDPTDLTVISSDEAPRSLVTSGVEFVVSGEAEESTLAGGSALITSQGQEVPGLGEMRYDVGAIAEPPALETLSDFGVPDGRTDDYIEAVERGRCVAGLRTSEPDKAKPMFSAAGANAVDVF